MPEIVNNICLNLRTASPGATVSRSVAKLENNRTLQNLCAVSCLANPTAHRREVCYGGVVFHPTVGCRSSVFQRSVLIHCLTFRFIDFSLLYVFFNCINKLTRKCIRFFFGGGQAWVSITFAKKWPNDDSIQIYLLIQNFHLSNASMLRKHTI